MEQRRTIVGEVALTAGSERRACHWLGFHRSAIRYRARRRDDTALRQRLRELAAAHPRWGSPLLTWQLRAQEGWPDNHKRIRRLYRAEGLVVKRRAKRKLIVARVPLSTVTRPNERWAVDFIRDTLASGAAFRALTLVDICTRESLAIEVDVSLGAERVIAVLEALAEVRGYPAALVLDNGPEFQSRALHAWAQAHGVQNAFIESFNGRFRDECLSQHWFLTLAEARAVIECWRLSYNTARSHRALGRLTPAQFAARFHPPTAAEIQPPEPTVTTRLSA
jgi:putative transposase